MLHKNKQQIIRDENDTFQMVQLSVVGDREEQQDSFGYSLKKDEGLVVVCDGMGGHEGGKKASEFAVKNFILNYDKSKSIVNKIELLINTAKETDKVIFELKNEYNQQLKAGSTLTAILIEKKTLVWCSVGDSRAYLIRNGEMVQLTQDHNYHTVLVEKMNAGLLKQEEFEIENARGEALISFLGIGSLALIDYSESSLRLEKDDKIVIMSDGLYKIVEDSEIARILENFSNIEEAVQALEIKADIKAKKSNVSRDNMTVALIKMK